jgi:hypothetical protein
MDSVTIKGQVKEFSDWTTIIIGLGDGPSDGILIVSHLI